MDDEFKLCWKNFQDNIASGFQNLYDRGDLVDVTLACDGKLLQAHKIVLAICSPYFQEIFTTNPCQHPIIILKDVSFNIMCELLEFMYQGVVNVKHTELQSFMKIGQLLQIKGLATNSNSPPGSNVSEKSTGQATNAASGAGDEPSSSQSNNSSSNNNNNNNSSSKSDAEQNEPKSNSRTPTASPSTCRTDGNHLSYMPNKRSAAADFSSDSLSIYSRKRRSLDGIDNTDSGSMEHALNAEEFFMPPIPHISMVEPRYDLGSLKREGEGHHSSVGSAAGTSGSSASSSTAMSSLRNPFAQAFNLDYNNFYKATGNSGSASNSSNNLPGSSSNNSSSNNNNGGNNNNNSSSSGLGTGPATEYPNELYMPSDYSKNFANHMDIPSIAPGEHWFQGKLEFMLSQRGKPLLVHDGHTFGIQYVRKDKKYWQCNLSRKFNCKARVTTTDTGEIIVTNNEHCHTEIRQHLRKDYQRNKVMMNALINLSTNRLAEMRRHNLAGLGALPAMGMVSGAPIIDEVVQNLHDLAKASAEASQQQQQQRAHEALKYENDEPLDCGIRNASALETMARSFMSSNTQSPNNDTDLTKEHDWPCKNEDADVH
ncbi:broad-complex core protein isoforms 1/2/3/4/5 isoform X2 [Drosophila navojoa]|uniref:broad-complex core protein isoforms 1/2/3/4/5 isoform X2 n=1 Tax=Drosophila navojoa TaxID=7232 RepID=UPI000846BA0C|nr:broad-complex core protein isoforms 1/2/3/4/5 isoform X2 [Drosophila navojoa]